MNLIKKVDEINFDVFNEIKNYALLTSGSIDNYNMMTATGFLYGKFFLQPMVQVYVRPTRYTYNYIEKNSYFTVSFYEPEYKHSLVICGEKHGNECDKAKEANLHPYEYGNVVLFREAKITFVCKKVFHTDISEKNFDSMDLHDDYYCNQKILKDNCRLFEKDRVYHRIYMGKIIEVVLHN